MNRSTKKTKTFDCVDFKRDQQRRWQEATRGMTSEERKAHAQRTIDAGPLAPFWRKVKQQAKIAPKRGRL